MTDKPQETSPSHSPVLALGRCMTSEVFELIADGDVRFFVNKDILGSKSKPFREATTGQWREAAERRIDLKDWDSDTVARLVEFLYIGDYPYPDPRPLKPGPESSGQDTEPAQPATEDPESDGDRGRPLTPFGDCMRGSLVPHRDPSLTDSQRLEPFDPAEYDFEDLLLAHARVYALANYKAVDLLRRLALQRLHLALVRLHPVQPASHIPMNLVSFASYVYANTDSLTRSQEPLRKLTSHFIALNMAAFQTEPQAVELVASGGDLVKDLMEKICRRLPDPEGLFATGVRSSMGYISNVKVQHGSTSTAPVGCLKALHGRNSNISNASAYGDSYPQVFPAPDFELSLTRWETATSVWLIPEYTTVAAEACTKFKLSTTAVNVPNPINLDRITGGTWYLQPVKDTAVLEKITHLALIRTTKGNGIEDIKEYDGMSADLSNNLDGGPIFLLWKSVKTRRV